MRSIKIDAEINFMYLDIRVQCYLCEEIVDAEWNVRTICVNELSNGYEIR